MERSEGPNLELMAQEPYLKPRVVSAPLSHPQASILDLVPDNMRPILGPIISDVDVVRPDIGQLNVALKSAGVDSESGISGCLGEGMAGGKLALQYLLSRSSGLGDLVRFSEQDEEQTFLEQELFSRYGSAPVMSMVGTGDYVAKQLIELLQKHSMAAHAARYHPTVAGEARQLEWDSTSQQRVLSVIVPFPKVQPLMEQVETPEALLERAHVFFTDETYVVDLEQALADQRHGLDLVTENDDDDLKGIIEVLENDDDLTPWTLLAVNLVSEKVDLGSLAKYLQENELFKGLVASSVINVAFLKVDNHIEPEQLYEVCREWQLPNEDATYLARLIIGLERASIKF